MHQKIHLFKVHKLKKKVHKSVYSGIFSCCAIVSRKYLIPEHSVILPEKSVSTKSFATSSFPAPGNMCPLSVSMDRPHLNMAYK